MRWNDSSKAYQGSSELASLADGGGVDLLGSAVIARGSDGRLEVRDASQNTVGLASLGGGGIGALVGVIGGPLGVLLGFAGGALVGSAYDYDRADTVDNALGRYAAEVPADTTALVAEVVEASPAAVDELFTRLQGSVLRQDADEVDEEIASAQDAAQAAAEAAAKAVRERKRSERKEHVQDKVGQVKDKFTNAFER